MAAHAPDAPVQVMLSSNSSFDGQFSKYAPATCRLAEAVEAGLEPDGPHVYLAQVPITADNELAPLWQHFNEPSCLQGLPLSRTHLWVAPRAARSSTHYDPSHNLLCVVSGTKTVRLWPPSATPLMRPCSVTSLSPNHSNLPLPTPPGAAAPAPAAPNDVVPEEMRVELQAGDALVIPEGWWHQVDSSDVTVAINFWWQSAASVQLQKHAPTHSLYFLRQLLGAAVDAEVEALLGAVPPPHHLARTADGAVFVCAPASSPAAPARQPRGSSCTEGPDATEGPEHGAQGVPGGEEGVEDGAGSRPPAAKRRRVGDCCRRDAESGLAAAGASRAAQEGAPLRGDQQQQGRGSQDLSQQSIGTGRGPTGVAREAEDATTQQEDGMGLQDAAASSRQWAGLGAAAKQLELAMEWELAALLGAGAGGAANRGTQGVVVVSGGSNSDRGLVDPRGCTDKRQSEDPGEGGNEGGGVRGSPAPQTPTGLAQQGGSPSVAERGHQGCDTCARSAGAGSQQPGMLRHGDGGADRPEQQGSPEKLPDLSQLPQRQQRRANAAGAGPGNEVPGDVDKGQQGELLTAVATVLRPHWGELGLLAPSTRLLATLEPPQMASALYQVANARPSLVRAFFLHCITPAAAEIFTRKLERLDDLAPAAPPGSTPKANTAQRAAPAALATAEPRPAPAAAPTAALSSQDVTQAGSGADGTGQPTQHGACGGRHDDGGGLPGLHSPAAHLHDAAHQAVTCQQLCQAVYSCCGDELKAFARLTRGKEDLRSAAHRCIVQTALQ